MKSKQFLFAILLLAIQVACAQDKPIHKQKHALNVALQTIKNDKQLKNASISFYAIDVKTGSIIGQLNPNMSLMPASTQKVVSTASILELYGAKYKFKTHVEYSGYIDTITHTLHGNIYIRGGGDPTLGSVHFYRNNQEKLFKTWTTAIKSLGIKKIKGKIIGDAQIYSMDIVPRSWAWEDMGNYYGAGACGLTVIDNLYHLHFRSGGNHGDATTITRTDPIIPNLTFDNHVTASNKNQDNAYIFGAPYNYDRFTKGTIPKGRSDFSIKGSIPDPAYYTAFRLSQYLEMDSVTIQQSATTVRLLKKENTYKTEKCKLIYRSKSPSLAQIVKKTNEKSINLFAEHCMTHCGLSLVNNGDNDVAVNAVERFWASKGMDTDGLHLADGSGLSRDNTITAKQLVFILQYMNRKSKQYASFYASLPIAGKTGTLRSIGKGTLIEGNLRAKSGSIRKVRAYTGYVKTRSGRTLAFAMNIANYNCSSSAARNKLVALMTAMASLTI